MQTNPKGMLMPLPNDSHLPHRSSAARAAVLRSAGTPALLCLFAATLLTGCMVGPKYHTPATAAQTAPPAYKEQPPAVAPDTAAAKPADTSDAPGPWKIAQPQDATLHGKWWEIFNDAELSSLEEQLNINNQNIKVYFENFMEARSIVREARASLFPTLTTSPAYTRTKASGNLTNSAATTGAGATTTTTGQQSSLTSLPGTLSWQPDLWGKIRNTIRSDQYSAQLSAADLENEKLTEQASLAEFYFELRGQDALTKILTDTVTADQKALDLTRALYETGVDNQISVVEAQTTLQSAQASLTNLGIARAQYEHAIAVLIGTNPSSFSMPVKPLTTAPPPIPVGLPSQLLERRPDIAGAERTMASANALIGVAYAAYYPTLTLSATGGFESSAIGKLLDWSSRYWSVGPGVSETIYDGGLRRATINQYIATYNADVASYRQTVLTAFQQVEDYLASVRILSKQIEQQRAAEQSAAQVLQLEMGRYETGIDPYIDVVTDQTLLLNDQQTLATLQIEQMTGAVELIQALGGGWDRTQLPTPAQITQKPTKAETTIQQ